MYFLSSIYKFPILLEKCLITFKAVYFNVSFFTNFGEHANMVTKIRQALLRVLINLNLISLLNKSKKFQRVVKTNLRINILSSSFYQHNFLEIDSKC